MAVQKGDIAGCVKAEHKHHLMQVLFCSTAKVGKMYYSVRWLLKIMSTSQLLSWLTMASTPADIASLYSYEGCIEKPPDVMSTYITYILFR